MTEIAPLEDVALAAASTVRLTVDAANYSVQDLEYVASKMTEKTYMDIANSDRLSEADQAAILRSAGGQLIFC
jgi:hypothetical protein